MVTKILLLLILGCGNNVKMTSNKLENLPGVDTLKYKKSGVLTKANPSKVNYQDKDYDVSKYSSKNAQEFINTLAFGVKTEISFTGGIEGNQIVLETIEKK
jgi:hypothetical protein